MTIDSSTPFARPSGEVIFTDPAAGGGRKVRKTGKSGGGGRVGPTPVTIVAPELTTGQALKRKVTGGSRLGTPVALLMLGGLALVYWALHSMDKKGSVFNGHFAGTASVPDPAGGVKGKEMPKSGGTAVIA
jgi:hypothetical protein